MPEGVPTHAQLWGGAVAFFSIDTDLLQAAGFNFHEGALHQLPRQLPGIVSLRLPEVVMREVIAHRMAPVNESIDKFRSASSALARQAGINLTQIIEAFDDLQPGAAAELRFKEEVEAYVEQCRGEILPIVGEALPSLFDSYFLAKPPFRLRTAKKAEFPDATSLWLLEQYAAHQNRQGIIASGDAGWKAFAAQSERLFHVSSIDELVSLFAASGDLANQIKQRVGTELDHAAGALRATLHAALEHHVETAEWDLSEFYTGSANRVDCVAYQALLLAADVGAAPEVWPLEGENDAYVVELLVNAQVRVSYSAEFFVWDSIDREEVGFGPQDMEVDDEIQVKVFLTIRDLTMQSQPDQWDVEADIAHARYSLDGIEVEIDWQ